MKSYQDEHMIETRMILADPIKANTARITTPLIQILPLQANHINQIPLHLLGEQKLNIRNRFMCHSDKVHRNTVAQLVKEHLNMAHKVNTHHNIIHHVNPPT